MMRLFHISWFVIAILFVQVPGVGALPFHQSPFDQTGYGKSFKDLVQKTSIIGKDDRGFIQTKGPEIGLSSAEIRQIRESTGLIVCPGTKYGNRSVASAALIGSNGQIITTAHSIMDELGRFREPLSDCYFQNQNDLHQKIPLDFSAPENYRMGADFNARHGEDYLIAKLKIDPKKNPLANVKPFPVDLSQRRLRLRQEMYLVSAFQEDMQFKADQPIVQRCSVGDVYEDGSSIIYSDCDTKRGASGGIHLVRNPDGQLVMKAIAARPGIGIDGQEYNIDAGSYSYSIGIDGPILRDLKEMYPSLSNGAGGVNFDKGI